MALNPVVGGTATRAELEEMLGYEIEPGTEVVERSDVHLMTTETEDIERYELVGDDLYRRVR